MEVKFKGSLDSIFDSSNDQYTNGNYQMAVEGYQSILNSGFESAELYYNLGNAFYKLNNIPESNFFYEKARSISPSDEDILMNLSFAQNLRIDNIFLKNFISDLLKSAVIQPFFNKSTPLDTSPDKI